MIEFISPVARFVQGSLTLETKMDQQTGKPKLGEDGQPIKEQFMAIAIRKDDPGLGAFYALFVAAAKADFPHLFDAQGQMTHPQFAWKIQDGDGVDTSGKSVKDKPGFAGHYIFKMGTRYLPKCFHHGKYDPTQQIQNPNDVIKKGYYVRVAGTIRGNGVTPQDRTNKPGLFVSPNLVELIAFGEEIVGGPDAAKIFGAAAPIGALPPGATAAPVLAAPGMPALTAPGTATTGLPGIGGTPTLPAVAAPAAGVPTLALPGAGVPTLTPPTRTLPGPRYVVNPALAAQGFTPEILKQQGWKDEDAIAAGHLVLAA